MNMPVVIPGASARLSARIFLSEKHSLCYAAVPKSACTTMKWWLAELEGNTELVKRGIQEIRAQPGRSISSGSSIHEVYPLVAPQLMIRTPDLLSSVLSSGRYYGFSIVRNPYSRLFSCWSQKILTGTYGPAVRLFMTVSFYSLTPSTIQEVKVAFECFVEHLRADPEVLAHDAHWMPQVSLLMPHIYRYDCIAQLEQPEELLKGLADRLGTEYSNPLAQTNKKNESIISYHPDLITPRAAQWIRELYAEDFSAFGYDPAVLPAARKSLDVALLEKKLVSITQKKLAFTLRLLAESKATAQAAQAKAQAAKAKAQAAKAKAQAAKNMEVWRFVWRRLRRLWKA